MSVDERSDQSSHLAAARHVEVYRMPGQFAGWPANYGLWIWGDEVVVVFVQGLLGQEGMIHARDRTHPFRPLQARSLDGGMTWAVERFNGQVPGAETLSADEHVVEELRAGNDIIPERDLQPLTTPIDFFDPETIVMAARTGIEGGAISWFYVSRDRARTWQGLYAFGDFGLPGISARTDIVPIAANEALFMLTATKPDGREGRIFCAQTTDGGKTFLLQGFVTEETDGYAIMPSSVRLPGGRVITAARRMGTGEDGWIDLFVSGDLGMTWTRVASPSQRASAAIRGRCRSCRMEGWRWSTVFATSPTASDCAQVKMKGSPGLPRSLSVTTAGLLTSDIHAAWQSRMVLCCAYTISMTRNTENGSLRHRCCAFSKHRCTCALAPEPLPFTPTSAVRPCCEL
jgi:hypothetical protein